MVRERMCVGCRTEAASDDLLRLVISPNQELVVDARARLPGRGVWVHPQRDCVQKASRNGSIQRAFEVPIDTSQLFDSISSVVFSKILDGISLAAANGALVCGRDVLEQALRSRQVHVVMVAEDASERTERELRTSSSDVLFLRIPLHRATLGKRIGRGEFAAVGIYPVSSSQLLRKQLAFWQALHPM